MDAASAAPPLKPLVEPLPEGLIFNLLRTCIHTARVLGYVPMVALSLVRSPLMTTAGIAGYYTMRFTSSTWRELVRRLVALGSSTRPRLIRAQTKPYDCKKQYLLAAHPHGLLNFGWWNLIARYGLSLVDGLQLVMCMAPAVQWYPLYGEIFGDRASDPSAATIRRILRKSTMTPAIIPGGFSEAVYTNADANVEYNYIADRVGFIRLAIEHGVDIIPSYSYGLNDMYATLGWRRQWRAQQSQATGIPMVLWTGPLGAWLSNNPYTEDVTVVTFDPFPASSYTLEQVGQAHKDYLVYLEQCFESRKVEAGFPHKRIEFIGRSKNPEATPRARL
jgi:hypothetical protein